MHCIIPCTQAIVSVSINTARLSENKSPQISECVQYVQILIFVWPFANLASDFKDTAMATLFWKTKCYFYLQASTPWSRLFPLAGSSPPKGHSPWDKTSDTTGRWKKYCLQLRTSTLDAERSLHTPCPVSSDVESLKVCQTGAPRRMGDTNGADQVIFPFVLRAATSAALLKETPLYCILQ